MSTCVESASWKATGWNAPHGAVNVAMGTVTVALPEASVVKGTGFPHDLMESRYKGVWDNTTVYIFRLPETPGVPTTSTVALLTPSTRSQSFSRIVMEQLLVSAGPHSATRSDW